MIRQFVKTFGEDAVPVASILESKDIAHFGKKGVVLPVAMARLFQILMDMEGGIDGIKRKIGAEVVARHSWHDLAEDEQATLERAVAILADIGEQGPMDRLDIVSFRSETRYGLMAVATMETTAGEARVKMSGTGSAQTASAA